MELAISGNDIRGIVTWAEFWIMSFWAGGGEKLGVKGRVVERRRSDKRWQVSMVDGLNGARDE